MSDIAIYVKDLSKQYHIGRAQQNYYTLRDRVADAFVAPFRRAGKLIRGNATGAAELDKTIWALKNVCFEVERGEVLGVIGRNGAGKSTLLKILSRITEPTSGSVDIHGRVGSLLEVGTGFHHELTGRENIYLNGAILGMKRVEIDHKFDEIVDFSEVEEFIDTPVKHYSSGMQMRLAFAVAAHLEPEIMIVDEVLAVGDVQFQKKCLAKMQDVGQAGRTVLFVSHNMSAITRLCERVIMLEEGKIIKDGPAPEIVSIYLNYGIGPTAVREWQDVSKAPTGELARLCAVRVRTEDGQITDSVNICEPVALEMEYEVLKSGYLLPHFVLYNEEGLELFTTIDMDPAWRRRSRPVGRYISTAWIPGNFLTEGMMFVGPAMMGLSPVKVQFFERDAAAFSVVDYFDDNSARGDWNGRMTGVIRPVLKWETQYNPNGNHVTVVTKKVQ